MRSGSSVDRQVPTGPADARCSCCGTRVDRTSGVASWERSAAERPRDVQHNKRRVDGCRSITKIDDSGGATAFATTALRTLWHPSQHRIGFVEWRSGYDGWKNAEAFNAERPLGPGLMRERLRCFTTENKSFE